MAKYCPYKDGPALYLDCRECSEPICKYFFCMVVGSRGFTDYKYMEEKLDHMLSNQNGKVVIVSGGARGADTLAERYAKEHEMQCMVFRAEWDKFGKSAGYIRNRKMHRYIAKQEKRGVVAFWDGASKGTMQNFDLAKQYDNQLRIIRYGRR